MNVPKVQNPSRLPSSPQVEEILQKMFAGYQRVIIEKELGGGFSGGRIFVVRPFRERRAELPAVIKMAPTALIEKEKRAYKTYIRNRLPNTARIQESVHSADGNWAGLRYSLIGGGIFEIESLYQYLLRAEVDLKKAKFTLKERLFESMGLLWRANEARQGFQFRGSYDPVLPVNLVITSLEPTRTLPSSKNTPRLTPDSSTQYDFRAGDYVFLSGFEVIEVESYQVESEQKVVTLSPPRRQDGQPNAYRVRLQLAQAESLADYQVGQQPSEPIIGQIVTTRVEILQELAQQTLGHTIDLTLETVPLTLQGKTITLPNPLMVWLDILNHHFDVRVAPAIHGDLNLQNILVDLQTGDVHLIDFADARRDHVLHDFLRLETEIVTHLLSPALRQVELSPEFIHTLYTYLHCATFHGKPFKPGRLPSVLEKPFTILEIVRQTARHYLFNYDDCAEYYQGLTIYLLGALKFKNLDRRAKQVAFWGAAALQALVAERPQVIIDRCQEEMEWNLTDSKSQADLPVQIPAFLKEEGSTDVVTCPVFVARERELEQLDQFLEQALTGQGLMVPIMGGAGRGKTALLTEFARRAQVTHPDLLVAIGHCSDYSGLGDSYLPFREVMSMLTGDVEAGLRAGSITRDHARRLWDSLPTTCRALLVYGRDLVGPLIPHRDLLTRAQVALPRDAPELAQLVRLAELTEASTSDLKQAYIFQQLTNVLQTLATKQPLLLLLDDLQWADATSISLLFHLVRQLASSRLLIVGAYRPDEVALGRGGERHPLEKVLTEIKRIVGNVWIDLSQTTKIEDHDFVESFLDTEPNRLGLTFRQELYRHTAGHPLFTIELLRVMQERGDIIQDETGAWIEGKTLDWDHLPPRVEAVIEERIGRLHEELRETLTIASVEGEEFTAQIVARVEEINERRLLRHLSQTLVRKHHLVRHLGEVQIGDHILSNYQFGHALIQRYLYDELSSGERRLLHSEFGRVWETIYGNHADEIAGRLAHHFSKAGEAEKALVYSILAAQQAKAAYANETALQWYNHTLEMLDHLGPEEAMPFQPQRLSVYRSMGEVFFLTGRYDEALEHCASARALLETNTLSPNKAPQLADLCHMTALVYERKGEYDTGIQQIQQGLSYLDDEETTIELARVYLVGALLYERKDRFDEAIAWDQKGMAIALQLNTREGKLTLARLYNHLGIIFWRRSDYNQAKQYHLESLAICQQFDDIVGQLRGYINLGILFEAQGGWTQASESFGQGLPIAQEIGDIYHQGVISSNIGFLDLQRGEWDQAMFRFEQSLSIWKQLGAQWDEANDLSNMAYIHIYRENWFEARQMLEHSQALFTEIGSDEMMPEVERHWAELYLKTDELSQALDHINRSIQLAAELSSPLEEGMSRRVLGQVHRARDEGGLAETQLRHSLQLLSDLDSKYHLAKTKLALASLIMDISKPEEAQAYLRQAIETFEKLGAKADLAEARKLAERYGTVDKPPQ